MKRNLHQPVIKELAPIYSTILLSKKFDYFFINAAFAQLCHLTLSVIKNGCGTKSISKMDSA